MSNKITHVGITYLMHRRDESAESYIRLPMTVGYLEMLRRKRVRPSILLQLMQALAALQAYDSAEIELIEEETDV